MKKYSCVDLFAGAGGFGLGFEMGGIKVKAALEIDAWAAETLAANNPNLIIINDDIRAYRDYQKIIDTIKINPDIIIGGPPCQGFSTANSKNIGDLNDPRNSLFLEFANWVRLLNPKVFVMENVLGLLTRTNNCGTPVIDIIKNTFIDLGYTVEVWQLNAAEYGVPQMRNRIFIVGNLFNKNIGIPTPTHFIPRKEEMENVLKPAITVWDAISDLPQINAKEGAPEMEYSIPAQNDFQRACRIKSKKVFNHESMKHTKRVIERYKAIQSGISMDDLNSDLKVLKRSGQGEFSTVKFQSNYRHLKPESISYTIPASFYSNFIHSVYPRNITSREAARLQSFPDTYIFKGKRTQISSKLLKKLGKSDVDHLSQYNQIGNAVPPLLAKAIALKIKSFLDRNIDM